MAYSNLSRMYSWIIIIEPRNGLTRTPPTSSCNASSRVLSRGGEPIFTLSVSANALMYCSHIIVAMKLFRSVMTQAASAAAAWMKGAWRVGDLPRSPHPRPTPGSLLYRLLTLFPPTPRARTLRSWHPHQFRRPGILLLRPPQLFLTPSRLNSSFRSTLPWVGMKASLTTKTWPLSSPADA